MCCMKSIKPTESLENADIMESGESEPILPQPNKNGIQNSFQAERPAEDPKNETR